MKIYFRFNYKLKKLYSLVLFFMGLFLLSNILWATEYSAGFMNLNDEQNKNSNIAVWYPSTSTQSQKNWDEYIENWAWQGEIAAGSFKLIVFSHGILGNNANNRMTAAHLAKNGYIVVAPTHQKDKWLGTSKTISAMEYRFNELVNAVKKIQIHKKFKNSIDVQQMGALGYSLGGMSILGVAGIVPNLTYIKKHCEQYINDDPRFCVKASWWKKIVIWFFGTDLVHWFYETGLEPKENFSSFKKAFNFKAIVLVTPVGAAYTKDDFKDFESILSIYRFGLDQVTPYPFHSEYLHKILENKKHHYRTYKQAHHYAFIGISPEWKKQGKHKKISSDPKGFNRIEFIHQLNEDILQFFNQTFYQ